MKDILLFFLFDFLISFLFVRIVHFVRRETSKEKTSAIEFLNRNKKKSVIRRQNYFNFEKFLLITKMKQAKVFDFNRLLNVQI